MNSLWINVLPAAAAVAAALAWWHGGPIPRAVACAAVVACCLGRAPTQGLELFWLSFAVAATWMPVHRSQAVTKGVAMAAVVACLWAPVGAESGWPPLSVAVLGAGSAAWLAILHAVRGRLSSWLPAAALLVLPLPAATPTLWSPRLVDVPDGLSTLVVLAPTPVGSPAIGASTSAWLMLAQPVAVLAVCVCGWAYSKRLHKVAIGVLGVVGLACLTQAALAPATWLEKLWPTLDVVLRLAVASAWSARAGGLAVAASDAVHCASSVPGRASLAATGAAIAVFIGFSGQNAAQLAPHDPMAWALATMLLAAAGLVLAQPLPQRQSGALSALAVAALVLGTAALVGGNSAGFAVAGLALL
ncbi:MAG: hypothetical protein EXR77_14835 [Myxococcales bacterium]|nr:hypothetical protein [Myxococcales bacterium]